MEDTLTARYASGYVSVVQHFHTCSVLYSGFVCWFVCLFWLSTDSQVWAVNLELNGEKFSKQAS